MSASGTKTATATARRRVVVATFGIAAAALPSAWMWGFTVDDALISVRYARHLVLGLGYRFDATGPATDGVTPLVWPFLLAPLARGRDAMQTLALAKGLGVALWSVAAAMLAVRAGAVAAEANVAGDAAATPRPGPSVAPLLSLVLLALVFPVGAWAASGMETGLATALATFAAIRFARPTQLAALAGLAAALRPELVGWSVVLAGFAALGPAAAPATRARRAALSVLIAAAPFVVTVFIRLVVFGRPAPLAVLAKPSDLSHGLLYAGASLLVLLLPIVAAGPLALRRAPPEGLALAVAFLVHAVVIVLVGGDWMPYARLFVPVTPSLVLVVVHVARAGARWAFLLRFGAAIVFGVGLLVRAAPAGRAVTADRADLAARARPVLADAKVVAALDIGWVSAATDAHIIDLAGLTDPVIAVLPGGHTSKRVDTSMLLDRDVDVMLVYSEMRVVEARIVRSALFQDRFEAREVLPVGDRGASYAVYRRRASPSPSR